MTDEEKIIYRGCLTDKQAAKYLGVGVDKIHDLKENGELGFIQKWGKVRFPKFELDNWMRRNLIYLKPLEGANKYRRTK